MKRTAYNQLLRWKERGGRKPLLLYGARQVGKTYLVKEFAEKEFENFVYVNCYKNEPVKTIFSGDVNIDRITLGLSAYASKAISDGKTLLFLDEIQEIPQAVSALKYFCEDRPGLHVVAAGSLLGVMNLEGESFPVGKVDIMHLYPMTFNEFLNAAGREQLTEIIEKGDWQLTDAFAETLKEYLRQYLLVGGMPEVVQSFVDGRDIERVRELQMSIFESYEADIAKHSGAEAQRIRQVWESLPQQLAKENKKFQYSLIRQGARSKEYERAIQWLRDAGLVYKIERVQKPGMPLSVYAEQSAFKLFMFDVGLLGMLMGIPPRQILIDEGSMTEAKGALMENYVLQQLIPHCRYGVYYYSRENSSLEIDFIVQTDDEVVPIEVKSGVNVRSKSFKSFVESHAGEKMKGVRFSMLPYVDQGWMVNVALYGVEGFFNARIKKNPTFAPS